MLPMDEKYDRKETREGEGEKYSSVPVVGRGDLVKTGSSSCIPTWRHFQIARIAATPAFKLQVRHSHLWPSLFLPDTAN